MTTLFEQARDKWGKNSCFRSLHFLGGQEKSRLTLDFDKLRIHVVI